jgi:putative ABC transport system permease protein
MNAGGGGTEELSFRELRTYTVVGKYERPSFEPFSAPGYTALTAADESDEYTYDTYVKLKTPKATGAFLESRFPGYEYYDLNSDLLRFTGNSDERTFNAVLFSLAGILTAIIMFGSISLIYNAFSISVSERTKQFGILSSVGATKRQLTRSVLFEAISLSAIGLPLGILAGLFGIGMAILFLRPLKKACNLHRSRYRPRGSRRLAANKPRSSKPK